MTNFLHYVVDERPKTKSKAQRSHVPHRSRLKKSLKMLGLLILVFFVMIGILVGVNYPNAVSAYEKTLSGKDAFERAKTELQAQDFDAAEMSLRQASEDFSEARDRIGKLWMLHTVPVVGRQYAAAKHLLDAGRDAGHGAADLTHIAVAIGDRIGGGKDFAFGNLSEETKAAILEEIYNSPPVLESAIQDFSSAVSDMEHVPAEGLFGPLQEATASFKSVIPPALASLQQFSPLARTIPEMVGHPNQKNYLLLFLNNTELRPGGGFIGTYAELMLKSGNLESLKTEDTYNLDKQVIDELQIEPPWPMKRFLGSTQWFLRDSNWSPDFRESSLAAIDFYQKEHGPMSPVDGVIGLTPDFIASLLAITGPITVDGITFTHENLVDELEYQVEIRFRQQGIPLSERKKIIGDLSSEIIHRVYTLPISEWVRLFDIFMDDIREKQIMFYFSDVDLQQAANDLLWTGEVLATDADYLRVVDANLGSLKSDPGVKRTITYTIRREQESSNLVATVDIYYVNNNDLTTFTTRYHTFTRVYAPEGSELLSYQWNEDIVETKAELGKTVFSTFKTIEPHEDEHLIFTYRLPDRVREQIDNGVYQLDLQKQLGTPAYPVIVDLDVNEKVDSVVPRDPATITDHQHVRWEHTLDIDQHLVVEF